MSARIQVPSGLFQFFKTIQFIAAFVIGCLLVGWSQTGLATDSVSSITLVNASNRAPLETIKNGSTIDLNSLSTMNLSLQAATKPSTVGSVKFQLDSNYTHTENSEPYTLCGKNGSSDYGCSQLDSAVTHTLVVTPYTGSNGGGSAGTRTTITFTVSKSGSGSGSHLWVFNQGSFYWKGDWDWLMTSDYVSTAISCLTGSRCIKNTPTAQYGMWLPYQQTSSDPNPNDTEHNPGIGFNVSAYSYMTIAIYPTKAGFAPTISFDYATPGHVDEGINQLGGNCVGLAGGDGSCPINGNYGPNPMVANHWNVYKIPLSNFNMQKVLKLTNGWLYKIAMQEHGSDDQQIFYLDQVGFTAD